MGHTGLALRIQRYQGVGSATSRPGVLGCAQEPDGIGTEAGGLGGAGNQDGRVLGFGGKESVVQGARKDGEKIRPGDAPAIKAQGADGFNGLVEASSGLELGAR